MSQAPRNMPSSPSHTDGSTRSYRFRVQWQQVMTGLRRLSRFMVQTTHPDPAPTAAAIAYAKAARFYPYQSPEIEQRGWLEKIYQDSP